MMALGRDGTHYGFEMRVPEVVTKERGLAYSFVNYEVLLIVFVWI